MKESRKRAGYIVFLMICMVAFLTMLQYRGKEHVIATAVGTVKVEGYLNVRSGPGTGYSLVKSGGTNVTLSDGAKVTITGTKGKWYHVKFTQNSKSLTGYISSDYVTVQTGKVCTKVYGKVNAKSIKVYQTAGKSTTVKSGKTAIALKNAAKVRILSESMVKDQKWYRISFSYQSKTYKGYVLSTQITLTCEKGLPGILNSNKTVSVYQTAEKKAVLTVKKQKVQIKKGKQFTILSQSVVKGKKYLQIKVSFQGSSVKGYIDDNDGRLQIVKKESTAKATAAPKVTAKPKATPKPTKKPAATAKPTATPKLTDAEYKQKLKKDGFPKSYVSSLLALHKKYTQWSFKPYKTGLKWDDVIKAESKVGLNLLSVNKSYAWKSTQEGAYDWTKDKYIPFDGSTWVTASEQAVKYYMDPRNFLDERGIFQFESLTYQKEIHTKAGVEKILQNTPMSNKSFSYKGSDGTTKKMKYSTAFMKAGTKSKVSPYHLASRAKQEVVISSNLMSSSVSGKVAGYEGIYNFYNIGANNSTVAGGAIANGLKWASSGTTYSRPWNSPYKSIVGGGSYIGKNYINVGQNTLYLQKFNVTSKNRYNHQYMGNVEAPNSEATKTNTAYGTDKNEMSMVFSIPVYEDMPDTACSVPSGGKNPNNYLKSLSVTDHAFASKFVLGDNGSKIYKLTVENKVTSIKINAKAVSTEAAVTGTGVKELAVGTKTYTVKVTSESGSVRNYKIKVTREEA